jgi:hypothetical protein
MVAGASAEAMIGAAKGAATAADVEAKQEKAVLSQMHTFLQGISYQHK